MLSVFKVFNTRSTVGFGGVRSEAETGLGLNLELALVLVKVKYLDFFQCLSNYNHIHDGHQPTGI